MIRILCGRNLLPMLFFTALLPLVIRSVTSFSGYSLDIISFLFFTYFSAIIIGFYSSKDKNGTDYLNAMANLTTILIYSITILLLGILLSYRTSFFIHFMWPSKKYGYNIYKSYLYILAICAVVYVLAKQLFYFQNKESISPTFITSFLLSLLTILFTNFILLYYLGLNKSIFIVLIIAVLIKITILKNLYSTIILLTIPLFYFEYLHIPKIINLTSNKHNSYMVLKNSLNLDKSDKGDMLVINNGAHSFLSKEKQGFPYIKLISNILFKELQLSNKYILVLGAGGFSLSSNNFTNKFLYIDIDPNIKQEVEKKFQKSINGDFIVSDARIFVMQNENKFDVVVHDAYDSITHSPEHLITKEYMLAIKKSLNSDGIAVFNMIIDPLFNDPFSRRIDNTIRSVFKYCSVNPCAHTNGLSNVIYVCKNTVQQVDDRIFTDDLKTSILDNK